MNLAAVLALGFFLGMRHATDADHVVAVSTIVARERALGAALPIGILWGLGHTVTILLVGGAIILFGVVIPPHVGLGMEMSVAVMLVLLGAINIRGVLRDAGVATSAQRSGHPHPHPTGVAEGTAMRPLFVGIVHGLAGSAAVALLVLGTIRGARWAIGYLVVFGFGTIAGMALITAAFAMPVAVSARRFGNFHRVLGILTGLASVTLGAVLAYRIGFVHGLFTAHPQWTPE